MVLGASGVLLDASCVCVFVCVCKAWWTVVEHLSLFGIDAGIILCSLVSPSHVILVGEAQEDISRLCR